MFHLPDPDRQPQFYAMVPTKRLLAWIIDMLVILAGSLIAVLLTAFVGAFVWPLLVLVIGFAYRVVTLANGSATWGMRFVGIEIRSAEGTRLDMPMALAHTTGYTISIALPILQVISIVMMLTSARGQGLTDAFLGTVALNRRAAINA
ncbi:RDD family protein [Sedimentitalea nanhaiensis]|uniref:RDD family protein n=1 Tax=Sedimentitalea nanhaiensis TaxID=999627 RepID=A0A1I6ZH07_9RHOB|nr:RDD family protein [Sedimentitalea nanhaiensis]SFT61957.1 RDD family protein [Sedimentitalea nanhaiensis]